MIDNIRDHKQQKDIVLFCFLDERISQMDAAQCVLRTLLYQFSGYEQPLVPKVLLKAMLWSMDISDFPMPLESFQQDLRMVLTAIEDQARVFFVLDGLDSDLWVRTIVVNEINRANSSRQQPNLLKCAFSSQHPYNATSNQVSVIEVNLRDELGVQSDIMEYATVQLSSIPWVCFDDECSRTSLAKELCSRANGMFLWVSLAIEHIHRVGFSGKLSQKLHSIPLTIEGIYQEILQGIPPRDVEIVQKILSWLTVARRPLYLSELVQAISIRADSPLLSVRAASTSVQLTDPCSEEDISRLCGLLAITTQEGVVRFRHPSVRRFLLCETRSKWSRHPIIEAHELLAQTCLKILESDDNKSVTRLFPKPQPPPLTATGITSTLKDYAVANWLIHYHCAEAYSRVLAGTLQRSLYIALDYTCDSYSICQSQRSIHIASTTLRICALNGFVSLTRLCLEMGSPPNGDSCNVCRTPLAIAAASGYTEVVALLLQYGASTKPDPRASRIGDLHLAAIHGSLKMVELFLMYGAHVDAVDCGERITTLHIAASRGHLGLVKLLIDYGVDVNATTARNFETPLHLAATRGHSQVVRCLLDGSEASTKGIELYDSVVQKPYYQSWIQHLLTLNGKADRCSWTADHGSAGSDMSEILSYSSRYADINMRTREGCTALHLAAFNGHESTVQLLLERGAPLQGITNARCTALQLAAENGHLGIVRHLLEAGADVNAGTEKIGTMLAHLEKNGRHKISNLIIWHFFCTELAGETCRRPLNFLATKSKNAFTPNGLYQIKNLKRVMTRVTRGRPPLQDRDMQA